eukprot:CAMPEP_0181243892 /NCGR_PEP_ID=MMETSP1096-20121128/42536_1 /TAXON_ID=156174 ORGANISM="Chrysochromulina ericina, Strain CCMP281" /NCGR_SAMPLE_ID=MMETSP1096 /ASSEMBLY_ACC=CAM_ASM_000453 /LENGTH=163 /DNA_ID=CAMNT_0023340339 /DNA_START=822 /DNA_END=1311 /DNA_ORIENTATION=-
MAVCTIHLSAMLKKESNAYFLSHGACLHKRGDSSSARQIDFSIAADEELSDQILPVDEAYLRALKPMLSTAFTLVPASSNLCTSATLPFKQALRMASARVKSSSSASADAVAALLHDLFISLRDALEGFRIATWLIWVRLERKLAVGGFNLSIGSVTPDAKHL